MQGVLQLFNGVFAFPFCKRELVDAVALDGKAYTY